MDKSYVSMEQRICKVCNNTYDTDALLLDKRLKNSMDRHTVTGYGLCKECNKPGYIALVECDQSKTIITNGVVKPENAYRTGKIAHLKREVANRIFNTKIDDKLELVFVEVGLIDKLKGE